MSTYSLAPLKLAALRITKLDACGVPDTGPCAMFAYKGVVSLDQTGETLDQVEFTMTNADGDIEEYDSDPTRLKYLKLDATLTKAVPEVISWMTGDDAIQDNAASPSTIGWRTQGNSSSLSNFALEGWTRLAGESSCSGTAAYGYVLYPWIKSGTFHAVKHENGLSELKISGITRKGSPWGVGPYSVNKSKAVATLGNPWPLFEAVSADDHKHFQRTELPPPLVTTACGPVVGSLTVVDSGAGLNGSATIPLPTATLTPGIIDWGDLSAPATVAAGALTATHLYALAGTYTVTYKPSSQSGPSYVGSVVIA